MNVLKELKNLKLVGLAEGEVPFQTTLVKAAKTLYPVWFMSYRNAGRVAYATVNGQTGKVAIDLPVDFMKYIGFSLLLTIPLFLLINWVLVLTPKVVCVVSIVAAVISLIISFIQISSIQARETHSDDEGYMDVNISKKKNRKKRFKRF